LKILLFDSVKSKAPSRSVDLTWEQLATLLTSQRVTVTKKEAVKLIGPYSLVEGTTRGSDNVTEVHALFVDIDDDGTTPNDATKLLNQRRVAHVVYSTHSSTRERPKYRVAIPLSEPVPGSRWREFFEAACQLYKLPYDPKTVDPSRIYYLPSSPPDCDSVFAWKAEGAPLDVTTIQRSDATAMPRYADAFDPFMDDAEPFRLPPKIDKGGRNDTLHRYAWHLLGKNEEIAYADLLAKVMEANVKRCVPPLPEGEIRTLVDSAVSHFERRKRQEEMQPPVAPDDRSAEGFENPPQYPPQVESYMYTLNETYAYIMAQSAVWKFPVRTFASPDKCRHDQSNMLFKITNRRNAQEFNAFDLWMKWRYRRQYAAIEYAPGQPATTAGGALNLWTGWPQQPRAGDVTLWHRLLDHVFGSNREMRRWFECWAAWPIQHPGAKLLTACIFWSAVEGSGKSSLGLLIGSLYGQHSRVIHGNELSRPFNAWAKDASFVLGEEVRSEDQRIDADRLKHLITGETIPIEMKFVDRFELPNRMNFMFNSNHPNAFFLTDYSRRYFIWEVIGGKLPLELGEALERWRKSEEGRSALMHYLLNVDTTDWSPNADAPSTESKEDMVEAGRTELERWLLDTLDGVEIVRVEDLKLMYEAEMGNAKTTTTAIFHVLRRLFGKMTARPIKVGGRVLRLRAIRNAGQWNKRDNQDWISAYRAWTESRLQRSS